MTTGVLRGFFTQITSQLLPVEGTIATRTKTGP